MKTTRAALEAALFLLEPGISMRAVMANALGIPVTSMHLSTSKYAKIILQQWIDLGKKLKLEEK